MDGSGQSMTAAAARATGEDASCRCVTRVLTPIARQRCSRCCTGPEDRQPSASPQQRADTFAYERKRAASGAGRGRGAGPAGGRACSAPRGDRRHRLRRLSRSQPVTRHGSRSGGARRDASQRRRVRAGQGRAFAVQVVASKTLPVPAPVRQDRTVGRASGRDRRNVRLACEAQ